MHDQIERTGKTEQHAENYPTSPEVIDLRAAPAPGERREPVAPRLVETPQPTRSVEVPDRRVGGRESSVLVWVVTGLAILASSAVILVVGQHPQSAAAQRPLPVTQGAELGLR